MQTSLSIIIPAYNESENIESTLDEVQGACKGFGHPFEVIVVDDCSTDGTGQKIVERARTFPEVRLLRNECNLGFGGSFQRGLQAAKMNYCVMVCGDDGIGSRSLAAIFANIGKADLVVPYTTNSWIRSPARRFFSISYVALLNFLFGLRIRYYNSHNVFPVAAIREMNLTSGFAYATQAIIRLVKQGYSFCEVPVEIKERRKGTSKAFTLKNILSMGWAIGGLLWEVHLRRRWGSECRRVVHAG